MLLGDLGKIVFLKIEQQNAKTAKEKRDVQAKIKAYEKEYANRFTKSGKLKKEFENKFIGKGFNLDKLGSSPIDKPKKKSSGPKMGVLTGKRAKRTPKGDITKKMNMGGVMKNRGGTFKGTF